MFLCLFFSTESIISLGLLGQQVYSVEEHGMDILMWSSSKNEENKWMYANVVLSGNTPFRVAFEVEVGKSEPTEFALDDISFTPECMDGGMLLQKYLQYCFIFRVKRKTVLLPISLNISNMYDPASATQTD